MERYGVCVDGVTDFTSCIGPSRISGGIPNVNAHLHTAWSFSAFGSIPQALDAAATENVRVVGINDFYSTDGYDEWARECEARRFFPLFGIEMIGLDREAQRAGLRVNDPANPGRTYLSGKGLRFPAHIPEPYRSRLAAVRKESGAQVVAMCGRLNELLEAAGAGFALDADEIRRTLTRGNLRERHLAKALRMAVYDAFLDGAGRRALLERLFGGKALKSNPGGADANGSDGDTGAVGRGDDAGVENEIRANLLKAGGAAFVPESGAAFLQVSEVVEIIAAAGGIPTYPFLGDDAKGGYTDFERDLEAAMKTLKESGIYSAEFITTRNSARELERYATRLWDEGFVVTFGSEHNTPAMEPVLLSTRDGEPLSDRLKEINYAGACVIAAHEDSVAAGGHGYLDARGVADPAKREKYIAHGDRVIKRAIYE